MKIEDLNEAISSGAVGELIHVVEARQRKVLSKIADAICARDGVRLVLVCGGSAAGKTTTAKRIVTQLKVNDRFALHLSTDDYFVGDDRTPRDANGELDYEHVECVDIARLVSDLNALFRGEAIPVRRFDFTTHQPQIAEKWLTLPSDGFIVLEGIHALNPRLTEGVDESAKYRVLIEPRPSLEADGKVLTPQEARFLRRLVRDNQFRKMPPSTTVNLWPKVLEGETKWIEPFRDAADAVFDSYLVYELAALKPYAGGLLEQARHDLGDRPEIVSKIDLLAKVEIAPNDLVPGDSILRETIGGSQLEY